MQRTPQCPLYCIWTTHIVNIQIYTLAVFVQTLDRNHVCTSCQEHLMLTQHILPTRSKVGENGMTFDLYINPTMASETPDGVVVCIREDRETLPLMIRPKGGKNSVEFLKSWIADNQLWLDEKMLEHGQLAGGCGWDTVKMQRCMLEV